MEKTENVIGAIAITLDLLTLLSWGVVLVISMLGNLYGSWRYPAAMTGVWLGLAFLFTSIALCLSLSLYSIIRPPAHSAT